MLFDPDLLTVKCLVKTNLFVPSSISKLITFSSLYSIIWDSAKMADIDKWVHRFISKNLASLLPVSSVGLLLVVPEICSREILGSNEENTCCDMTDLGVVIYAAWSNP